MVAARLKMVATLLKKRIYGMVAATQLVSTSMHELNGVFQPATASTWTCALQPVYLNRVRGFLCQSVQLATHGYVDKRGSASRHKKTRWAELKQLPYVTVLDDVPVQ